MRAPRQFRRILLVGEQLHATVFKHRLFGRQGTGFLIFGSEVTGGDLTGFHIRLIEWIDADDRSRHSGGDLPTEELLTQIVNVRHRDAHHRMPSFFERRHLPILLRLRSSLETHIRENAIVPIKFRRAQPLPIYGDDAFPLFAGGLGQELLKPCAQV